MLGFPIRKSSDHSSVDSSPRLIAASYVLHRLLVPRHPPCALNNLATQKSHPSTPGRTSMSGPTQTLATRVRRCSRPLCSSQRTTRHPPQRPRRTRTTHGRRDGTGTGQALNGEHAPARFPGRPAPSGPNSVPTTPAPRATPVHTPHAGDAVLGADRQAGGRTSQRSTLEHRHEHPRPPGDEEPSRPAHGPGPLPRRRAASAP